MPRVPLHALIWSSDQSHYELYTQGQLQQRFRSTDEAAWLAWLGETTSFAFHGACGSLNVYLLVHPVLVGGGKPLFHNIGHQVKLHLVNSKTHPSGVVVLAYQPREQRDGRTVN